MPFTETSRLKSLLTLSRFPSSELVVIKNKNSTGGKMSRKLKYKLKKQENKKAAFSVKQKSLKPTKKSKLKKLAVKPVMTVDEKIKSSQFRFLNERLYTCTSSEAADLFAADTTAFATYHHGYEQQRTRWPVDPLQRVASELSGLPASAVVADMGCGDGRLTTLIRQKTVYSFDLVALNPQITVCDIANTPLRKQSVDVVVFCLSLMGTNANEFIAEASRILKKKGTLLVTEIESRIERFPRFIGQIEKMGFTCSSKHKDDYFVHCKFTKTGKHDPNNIPLLPLMPCLYKKR